MPVPVYSAAEVDGLLAGIVGGAPPMVLHGAYNQATDATFNVDSTWANKVHVFQPAAPAVFTLNFPLVSSLHPFGMRMWLLNNSPYAPVRILLPTDPNITAPHGRNSICGNHDIWNIIGDECIEIQSDQPAVSATDWKLLGKRPGVRQQYWAAPFTHQFSTASTTYVNCTGMAAKMEQPLQSYSSRERVHVEGHVTCDTDASVVFFTLNDGSGDLHTPGTLGMWVKYCPNRNQPVPFSFTYERPGGLLTDTTAKTFQLRAHGTGQTLRIGSDGSWPYETKIQIQEIGVA